jgi:serine/threonine protein kinase, bacterial
VNPQRLGSRYLLHDRLGQGAMGVVWRGQDMETGAWVAVKLLRPEYAASPAAVSRFVGERNALVRFRHPNVVNLRDMIVEGDRLALVMDLITGGDLDTFRLHNGGTLAPKVAVRLTAQICDGLAAAHTAGIVHRDLKPSNVLLQAGQVKIADFGISRITGEARRTTTGTVMGTPTYLAPEAINGAEPTSAADVYAVGITLYELLSSQPPFDGHVVAVMQAHLQREPERIQGIADPLWDQLAACLSKDPAGRPAAADLARSLKALDENAGAAALGPGPETGTAGPAPTRTVPQLSRQTSTELTGQAPAQLTGRALAGGQTQAGGPSFPGVTPQPQAPAHSPGPAESPVPAQSPHAMLSPMPVDIPTHASSPPPGPPGGTLLAQAGPLATPPADDGRRKRLLIGLAALVVVVAVTAIVYAAGFSNSSSTSHLTSGLTKPTIGTGTSPAAPTTPGTRRGHHHAGSADHTGDPTPTGSPTSSSTTPGKSGHPAKKPTSPASVPPTSPGSSQSPTQKATPPATPTPPPVATWECGNAAGVIGTGETLTSCIEYTASGALQVEARLANVNSAGQTIEFALSSPTEGTYNSWQTACAGPKVSTTCTSQVITITGAAAGNWYSSAELSISGTIEQGLVAKSQVIYFPG